MRRFESWCFLPFEQFMPSVTKENEFSLWYRLIDNGVYIAPSQAFYADEQGWFRIIFARPLDEIKLCKKYQPWHCSKTQMLLSIECPNFTIWSSVSEIKQILTCFCVNSSNDCSMISSVFLIALNSHGKDCQGRARNSQGTGGGAIFIICRLDGIWAWQARCLWRWPRFHER